MYNEIHSNSFYTVMMHYTYKLHSTKSEYPYFKSLVEIQIHKEQNGKFLFSRLTLIKYIGNMTMVILLAAPNIQNSVMMQY